MRSHEELPARLHETRKGGAGLNRLGESRRCSQCAYYATAGVRILLGISKPDVNGKPRVVLTTVRTSGCPGSGKTQNQEFLSASVSRNLVSAPGLWSSCHRASSRVSTKILGHSRPPVTPTDLPFSALLTQNPQFNPGGLWQPSGRSTPGE